MSTIKAKRKYYRLAWLWALFLLSAQLALAAHTHADDLSYEACSTCLLAEHAELDDVIPSSSTSQNISIEVFFEAQVYFEPLIENRRLSVYRLRGPPV